MTVKTKDKRMDMLDFCGHSPAIASAGRHARLFVDLQGDVDDLLRMIRHLMVYDVVAADFYGFDPRRNVSVRSIFARWEIWSVACLHLITRSSRLLGP